MEALVSKASLICCRSTPAPATTSAPLFYLRAIIAGAMRAAVLLLPTPMQSTSD
jgi:hypothetical protein